MTTEHVSVPRELLQTVIAALYETRFAKTADSLVNILSRATSSDVSSREDDMYEHGMSIFSNTPPPEKPGATRVVTDEDVMRACRAYNNPPGHMKPSGYATPHMMRAALESFVNGGSNE